jgi:hypothetical protein
LTAERKVSIVLRWGRAKVVELFGADLRSLAALRIVLAALVLGDIASRTPDLYAHYTDEGILPRTALLDEGVIRPWQFSLNLVNGEAFFQALVFTATVLAALGLLLGYRTRLMTVIVWGFLISIQMRNNLLNGAGEALLDMLLFWGIFLPLGAYWSVDRARQVPAPRLSTRFLSMATVGLFMQIAFVYWFTALLKSDPEWRVDGTALYYALSIDQIATPIGTFLLQFPVLLKVLTFATIGFEALGPFLLFFPFFTGPVRTAAVLAFMSFHFGIWLTMDIGIFPWIGAFCMVCFLPSWFWDKTADVFGAQYAEQSGAALEHSGTQQRLSQHLGIRNVFRPFLSDCQPRLSALRGAVRSYIENAVTDSSKDRQIAEVADALEMHHETAAGSTKPTVLRSSLASNLLAFVFLLYILFSNITSVSELKMPELLAPLGSSLNINQEWAMFAPGVLKNDGWYVIPGDLEDGQEVDLMGVTHDDFSLHEVLWEKPQDVRSNFKNEHWRKYLEMLRGFDEYIGEHQYLARYICREWNARHTGSEQLTNFEIVYMSDLTLPDYEYSAPKQNVIWEHSCF